MLQHRIRYLVRFAAACLLAGLVPLAASAQSTDGYHSVQIIPVVVDSGSFVQRFNFQNNNGSDITLTPRFYPGNGATQLTPIVCPNILVPANGEAVVTSLRTLCPALGVGSQFGFLYLSHATGTGYLTYSAFSRVSNIAGAGFTVEGFPGSTFSSATSVVTGIRRLAASGNAPAYQTNCFLANMPVFGNSPIDTPVHYVIRNSAGAQIGSGDVTLSPGKLVRLLDIFAAGAVAPGDQDDAMITFVENGPAEPGLITFCTVQDNTSFGADFRIAKAARAVLPAFANPNPVAGPEDILAARDIVFDGVDVGTPFTIPAGAFNNLHVIGYHASDYVQCEIINPNTGLVAAASYGLEIRATDPGGATNAGGNNSVVVPDPGQGDSLFTGNRDDNEANGYTFLQVESNGQNTGSARPYKLRCRSGSGMTLPFITRYQVSGTQF